MTSPRPPSPGRDDRDRAEPGDRGPGPGLLRFTGPQVRAAVLTEVNPRYEPSGVALSRYIDAVAGALATALTQGT